MSDLTRRSLTLGLLGGAAAACSGQANGKDTTMADTKSDSSSIPDYDQWQLSNKEWKTRLSPEAYAVLRKEATERPRSSELNDEKREGIYACAGCGFDLFKSADKFESGTGWPSFIDYIPGALETKRDFKLLLPRTEYHCVRCGGHQGHLFKDGPAPTGLRYCNNGVALTFRPDEA
ncbi:MAG: peptide-methionine (R)-S-oxide reductase MsrB [Marinicaulis sp.]|nr:peptide-methionine (R)-S-oxide reductase MsrB [Marinicaulis sp.]